MEQRLCPALQSSQRSGTVPEGFLLYLRWQWWVYLVLLGSEVTLLPAHPGGWAEAEALQSSGLLAVVVLGVWGAQGLSLPIQMVSRRLRRWTGLGR